MSTTSFTGQVTQIPAAWANDVNRLVYDLFGAPVSLDAVKTLLGLDKLTAGGFFTLTAGSINGTPIGATQAATGRFTELTKTGTGSGLTDVVTYSALGSAITGITGGLGTLAAQDATAVLLSGGAINGVEIGGATPAAGFFTTLQAQAPVDEDDVALLGTLNTRFSSLPNFGTIVSQNAASVILTGGLIDGVTLGSVNPASAAFTSVVSPLFAGENALLVTDNSVSGSLGYALFVDGIGASDIDMGFRTRVGGRFTVSDTVNGLSFGNGRLVLNGYDDGSTTLQVNGSVTGTVFTSSVLTPTAAGHLSTKNYVDSRIAYALAAIGPAVTSGIAGLGSIAMQSQDSINIGGGSINGTTIGGTVRAAGSFSQVNTTAVVGQFGLVNLQGTGGYANSGLVLGAVDSTRPSISVVPNVNGAFAVMSGGVPVFRTHAVGRTVVGVGGDDGLNTMQVYGNAAVHGRLTLDSGTMSGSVTPTFGATAPTLMNPGTPIWTRIRIVTSNGVKECVVPAYEVM